MCSSDLLALWPKGDGWGGGGLFETRRRIALNHRPAEMYLADGFRMPKSYTVHPFGEHSGWGEDDPIWSTRLERDGWIRTSQGTVVKEDFDARVWIEIDPPIVWEKRHPLAPKRYMLQMSITGVRERVISGIERSISSRGRTPSGAATGRIGRPRATCCSREGCRCIDWRTRAASSRRSPRRGRS